jgi:hypothetical protein
MPRKASLRFTRHINAVVASDRRSSMVCNRGYPDGRLRNVGLTAVLMLQFVGALRAEEQPRFFPAGDVSVAYDATSAHEPLARERMSWSASGRLQRMDGPGPTATIFDRNADSMIFLNSASRTYTTLAGVPRWAIEPDPSTRLTRGSDLVITGLHCTEWSWMADGETRTVCVTLDGVPLRLVVDGELRLEARSVSYGSQPAELFQVPADYALPLNSPQAPRLVR